MKTIVLYDTRFGNTERVAKSQYIKCKGSALPLSRILTPSQANDISRTGVHSGIS